MLIIFENIKEYLVITMLLISRNFIEYIVITMFLVGSAYLVIFIRLSKF